MSERATAGPETTVRIRLHGRGGHGVKTASRVVGTAAFLAGLQAQDSPFYGAERRGAAVAAFVRIGAGPIRERGPIADPDLIVVADETLLQDPTAGVQVGRESASGLFVNSAASESQGGAAFGAGGPLEPLVQTFDLSGRTRELLGRASALSAGLAAAAARLSGRIPRDLLLDALRSEFADLHVSADVLEKNLQLAGELFDALEPVPLRRRTAEAGERWIELAAHPPRVSVPSILSPGNAERRRTGAWRVDRPVIDVDRCTRCGLCFTLCPDGAVRLDDQGRPQIDYDHCKGCLICQQICPLQAIGRERETGAW